MSISNRCILPECWTEETLMEPHDSMPYNPDVADVFYRAGYIEHRGRGIEKICEVCEDLGAFLELSHRTLQRKMYELQAAGKIERIVGKRYGHWVTH